VTEEILRSSYLPDDVLAGTKLFLTFEPAVGQYIVRTRFQAFYRSRKGYMPGTERADAAFERAAEKFEAMLAGTHPRRNPETPVSILKEAIHDAIRHLARSVLAANRNQQHEELGKAWHVLHDALARVPEE
jgi:hypothetical protein